MSGWWLTGQKRKVAFKHSTDEKGFKLLTETVDHIRRKLSFWGLNESNKTTFYDKTRHLKT